MRAFLVPAAAAAVLLTATSAFALNGASEVPAPKMVYRDGMTMHSIRHDMHTTGHVKSFNGKTERLILANGERFVLPRTFAKMRLNPGERVAIAWHRHDGKRFADRVTILS